MRNIAVLLVLRCRDEIKLFEQTEILVLFDAVIIFCAIKVKNNFVHTVKKDKNGAILSKIDFVLSTITASNNVSHQKHCFLSAL